MSNITIATILLTVIALVVICLGIYFWIRNRTLDDIREEVYQKFLEAEHKEGFEHSGQKKMEWVLRQARGLLPGWVQPMITDSFLKKVVQGWFDAVKDLLDDGKLNQSVGTSEN